MKGCVLYTAVAIPMDAREYAANSKTQFATIATPLITAQPNRAQVNRPGRRKPIEPQITNKVAAPIAQRQNTTSSTGCPDTSTHPPIVPEINIAPTISREQRLIS